jgi:predicted RNase H-like HicB family nuclease
VGLLASWVRIPPSPPVFPIAGELFMENKFTAVFERDGDWWIGYVEELPGANTQGATLDEARENLKEAVALLLEANRDLADKERLL